MTDTIKKVAIVGAGPCGTVLALMLARKGVKVDLFEALPMVDQRPRGLAYGPAGVHVLQQAGIVDEIRADTFEVETMGWRELDGTPIVSMHDMDQATSPDRFLLYPVHMLTNRLMSHLEKEELATVHFSHTVIGAGQDAEKAWLDVESEGKTTRHEADFVVGCDGATSPVRKSLFGRDFPGFTFDFELVVLNIKYDLDKYNWYDCQWIIHPEHWGLVVRLNKEEGTWRVCYSDKKGLTEEEYKASYPKKLETMLPGAPRPDDYEIHRFSPYVVHQRCVEHMRQGRILLAGDAAHLTNPMGGLGLTGGLADIGGLIDCFYGIIDGKAIFDIFDKWDEERRDAYHGYIEPTAVANLKRLMQEPKGLVESDPLFQKISAVNDDPIASANLQLRELVLLRDMTQYYVDVAARE